jgi:hypothetical protein
MLASSHRSVPAPRDGLTVLHVQSPSVPYYRSLYNAVGKDFYWLSRRKMTDEALAIIITDPRDELQVLHVDGTPAGFAELDRRQPDEIELVQFGLTDARFHRPGAWEVAAAMDHRESLELRAETVLVAHLHAGSPHRFAELHEGRVRVVQRIGRRRGANPL